MTPIPPNDSYNKMSHFLQNDDLQTFFVLNNGMVTTRVMESINTNSGHLNLTNTKLDLFASDIFYLSMFRDHLYTLSLGKNLLRWIPKSIGNLSVLNHLDLSKNRLISIPGSIGNLQELRVLDLSYNPNLSSLPKEILNLPNSCAVDIDACNFSRAVLDRLQESTSHPDYIGPQISHSMMNTNPNIEESLQHFYTIINKVPSKLLELNRTETLRIWLHRLCHIDDYRKSQKEFITKIISYLEKANADEGFREIFFITIDDAVETCEDKVALSVLQLGINYQLETISPNNIQGLADFLIKGVWVLEILHGIAREKVKHCPFFDAIEVYLGYPIKLKEQLNLPIDVTNTLFFNYSGLTPLDLETAKNVVLATITDQEKSLNFLISQPKWIESLEHNYKKEYLSIIHRRENDRNSDGPDYMIINNTYETQLKTLTMRVLDWE